MAENRSVTGVYNMTYRGYITICKLVGVPCCRGELEMDREGGRWGSDPMNGFMNDMNDEVWKMVWKRDALCFLLQIVFLVFFRSKVGGGS